MGVALCACQQSFDGLLTNEVLLTLSFFHIVVP